MTTRLLDTKQAATYLGVSATFLERDRWAGARIPSVRVGVRAVRYRERDLADYVDARLRRSTGESPPR